MEKYDPNKHQDQKTWLNLSNEIKARLILNFHNENNIDIGDQPYLHVFKHLTLENYLASDKIQTVKKDINKLINKGFDRHDALHKLFNKIDLKKASYVKQYNNIGIPKLFGAIGAIILIFGLLITNFITIFLGGGITIISVNVYFKNKEKEYSSKEKYGYDEVNSDIFELYRIHKSYTYLLEEEQKIKTESENKDKKVEQYLNSLDFSEYTKNCPQCDESIKLKAKVCRFCNYSFSEQEIRDQIKKIKQGEKKEYEIDGFTKKGKKLESEKQERIAISEENIPTCPYCSSKHIETNKKGYGLVKGLTGTVLVGPVGLLGGFVGSRKIQMTCLSCGKRWNLKEKDLLG